MIATAKKSSSFVTRPFASSQNHAPESDLDFLKVLPYLWQGGSFNQLIHLAIELDVGAAVVRSRCEKLANLGIVQAVDDDSYDVTELGKNFCQLTYGKLSDAEAVLDKVSSELQQLALAHASAYPDKNKGRIKLLTPALSTQHPAPSIFWRAKSGLHPVGSEMGEETIACHLLPIPDQIQLCRDRIAQQQARLEDIRESKPSAANKVEKEVQQIVKEECDRISRLSALQEQPAWVKEASEELNHLQGQLDNCSIEHEQATDAVIKKALWQGYKEAQAALTQVMEKYSQLADECGYKLNMQSSPREDGYNDLLVWVEEKNETTTVRENGADQEGTQADAPKLPKGTTTGSLLEGDRRTDVQVSQVSRLNSSETSSNSSFNGGANLLHRQREDLALRQETPRSADAHGGSLRPSSGQAEGELTLEEERELTLLEKRVEQGLYSAWAALRDIREKRLYRPETWEAYCIRRFGYKSGNADWKIHAANVYEVLETDLTFGKERLPSTERQVRAMRGLPEEQWVECWEKACEQAPGVKPPSESVVRDVVFQLKGIVVNVRANFKVGDVVIISKPRGLDGCWGIVENVGEFTITVATWKESVQLEDPNKTARVVDIPVEKQSILDIWKRCKALRECPDLDPSVYWVLEGLGRCTYLTPMQENLLTMFEAEYL